MTDGPTFDVVTAIIRVVTPPLVRRPAIPAIDMSDYRSGPGDSRCA
jgi:hypothetical protein